MSYGEQLEFTSISFDKDRKVCSVAEVAGKLDVTQQHVQDLIEEGELQAVNVGGAGPEYVRIPFCFFQVLSEKTGLHPELIARALQESKDKAVQLTGSGRKFWRIPVEAYTAFLKCRHSFHPTQLLKFPNRTNGGNRVK